MSMQLKCQLGKRCQIFFLKSFYMYSSYIRQKMEWNCPVKKEPFQKYLGFVPTKPGLSFISLRFLYLNVVHLSENLTYLFPALIQMLGKELLGAFCIFIKPHEAKFSYQIQQFLEKSHFWKEWSCHFLCCLCFLPVKMGIFSGHSLETYFYPSGYQDLSRVYFQLA